MRRWAGGGRGRPWIWFEGKKTIVHEIKYNSDKNKLIISFNN